MTDHDCEPLDPCPVCEADKAAYDQGRADERAAIVAWLRGKAHDPTWLRAHGVQSRQGVCTLEEAADDIERGDVRPGRKHLAKLAEVLGLEIADLLPRIQPDLGANQ